MMKKLNPSLYVVFFAFAYFSSFAYAERLVMITGANRGLGLLLSEQFAQGGDKVIAVHRHNETPASLNSLKTKYPGKIIMEKLDLTDLNEVIKLGEQYRHKKTPIDILINNAGIYSPREPQNNTFQNLIQNLPQLEESMHTNAEAPMLLSSSLLPNITQGTEKMIIFLGSAGSRFSVDDNKRNRMGLTYVMSKSALHKAIDQAATDLKNPQKCLSQATCKDEQQVTMVGIDPGWVDTDMGKGSKNSQPETGTAEQATKKIYQLITSGTLNHTMSGQLINTSGQKLDW
ncbi:SDR family NAD(P)-dependent oxidoreductase [Endozoicomonas sp. Mp262]|uniref:SDR family NAD(P)-dependent oxidoreductase n=1 Tax=Endozoicomonas sp. Mp262 TaxID=2919499 RepID=UPI0021DA2F0D